MAGLPAVFSAMVLPFSPSQALPWVLVSWAIVALSGYRIWRIDHPGESARYEVSWRVKSLLTAVGIGVITLALQFVLQFVWVWAVAAAIVVCSIFLVIYAVANRNPGPGPAAPVFSHDDPPART
jgi:peptidoglycan/LPS O-acetylase OafA/YrhL